VAVTTRDFHPLPYSLVSVSGQRAPESNGKNNQLEVAPYHALKREVNATKKLKKDLSFTY